MMDYAAIDATVRRHVQHLACADPSCDADDLVQIAWERGLARLDSSRTERECVAYLVRLARNAAIDRWRWARIRPTCALDEGRAAGVDLADAVVTALLAAEVAGDAPQALVLWALGYAWREAGTLVGLCENTAKVEAFRWRRDNRGAEVWG